MGEVANHAIIDPEERVCKCDACLALPVQDRLVFVTRHRDAKYAGPHVEAQTRRKNTKQKAKQYAKRKARANHATKSEACAH